MRSRIGHLEGSTEKFCMKKRDKLQYLFYLSPLTHTAYAVAFSYSYSKGCLLVLFEVHSIQLKAIVFRRRGKCG